MVTGWPYLETHSLQILNVGYNYMKTLLTIITLIMTMLIVNSCRKNKVALFDGVTCSGNCYILAGKLIDSATTGGIAHGELKFYFEDITGTFSSKKNYLGKAITDVNGNYTFRFDGSRFKNLMGYYYTEAFSGSMFGGDLSYPNRVATFNLDTSFYNLQFIQNLPLFRPAIVKVRVVASAVTNFQFLTVGYSYGKTETRHLSLNSLIFINIGAFLHSLL